MHNFKDMFEKAKFSKAGGGYIETFLMDSEAEKSLRVFLSSVEKFIGASDDSAEEEGLSSKQQQEMIIDDILSYLNAKLK